jgi:Ca2+/Na+ antiporter
MYEKSLNRNITALALVVNALISIAYRFFKWIQIGNLGDLIGQTALGVIICLFAYFCWQKRQRAFTAAAIYGVFFLIVTPLYTINILLPSNPGIIDHLENIIYTIILVVVVIFSYKSLKELREQNLS